MCCSLWVLLDIDWSVTALTAAPAGLGQSNNCSESWSVLPRRLRATVNMASRYRGKKS